MQSFRHLLADCFRVVVFSFTTFHAGRLQKTGCAGGACCAKAACCKCDCAGCGKCSEE